MRARRLAIVAAAILVLFSQGAGRCDEHTVPGQKVYSPLINDIVLWAQMFPSAEFADVIYNVPKGSANTGPFEVRGTWYKGFDGHDSASMHVRTESEQAHIRCIIFQRVKVNGLKSGMQVVDQKDRYTQDEGPGSITCVTPGKLPCRVRPPNITFTVTAWRRC